MKLDNTITLNANKDAVWIYLSDPDVLMSSIPGTEDISRVDDRTYSGTICRQVAGVTISMNGEININKTLPYDRITATITGVDDQTGSRVDGRADLSLIDRCSSETEVHSSIELNFGGKLASIGSRILCRQLRADTHAFFSSLEERINSE